MSKKILILILPLVIILALLASNFSSINEIEDAAVNMENGDVALAYYDSTLDGFWLESYDCDGILLFRTFYDAGGGSIYLEYAESVLHIYVGRTGMYYAVDRSGTHVKAISDFNRNSSFGQLLTKEFWNDWERDGRNLRYACVGKEYCYEKSSAIKSFFRKGYCVFYIKNEVGDTIELYRSDS